MNDSLGTQAFLHAMVTRADGTVNKFHSLKDFLSEFVKGSEDAVSAVLFPTNLTAHHYDGDGKLKHIHDLGSGLTTNIAALALANDFGWASPSAAAINTLKACNFHATGTGATAAAQTDIKLQTADAVTPVSGVQTLISAANVQKLQTIATLSYAGSEAVTEWGLFNSATLTTATGIGTPFTATTASSATVTGTPLTASSTTVQGAQQSIVLPGTTTVWGLVTANTTSVLTVPAWYKVADGTLGATPGATEAYTKLALMWDHKVFAAINVLSGDSIQFTYQLTVNSGG